MRPSILLVLGSLLLSFADARAQPASKADLVRLSALFTDQPNVRDKRYVTVVSGTVKRPDSQNGWLVDDTPAKIAILSDDGYVTDFKKPTADSKRREAVLKEITCLGVGKYLIDGEPDDTLVTAWEIKPADFAASARKLLKEGPPAPSEGIEPPSPKYGLGLHLANLARLARAAHQRGEDELAAEIYAGMRKWLRDHDDPEVDEATRSSKERLHRLVGEFLVDHKFAMLREDCFDETPWSELKSRAEKIAAMPDHSHRDELLEYARLFGLNAAASGKELADDASVEGKVRTQLHRVRNRSTWYDQCFEQAFLDDGAERGPVPEIAEEKGSIERLGQLGLDAIPALIAHLDDPTLTRIRRQCCREDCCASGGIIRVADVCQRAFEKITGHTLSEDLAFQAGKSKEAKAAAERWMRDFAEKGTKRMLVDATETGDRDSSRFGYRLVTEFPDVAFAPIVRGARAAKNPFVRASLVASATRLKEAGLDAFLHNELKGPFVESRLAAARALIERDRSAAVATLLRDWNDRRANGADPNEFMTTYVQIRETAIRSGDYEAIKMWESELSRVDVHTRTSLLWGLPSPGNVDDPATLNPAVDQLIEDTLIERFRDHDISVMGTVTGRSGRRILSSMADVAASTLCRRLSTRFEFDNEAPFQTKEKQRRDLVDLIRKSRGLEPLPAPKPRVVPSDDGVVGPLLEQIVDATSNANRKTAVGAVERLGPSALPALRKRLESVSAGHPARPDLQNLAARLPRIVTGAEIAPDSQPISESIRKKLAQLVGKPATEPEITAILTELAKGPEKGIGGCRMIVERLPDNSGVLLVVALTRPEHTSKLMRTTTCFGHHVVVNGEHIAEPFQDEFADEFPFGKTVQWVEFSTRLQAAFDAPADQPVQVIAYCRRTTHER
jgi:hypothetical protein